MFSLYSFCTFSVQNKTISEDDVQTSKHVAVL